MSLLDKEDTGVQDPVQYGIHAMDHKSFGRPLVALMGKGKVAMAHIPCGEEGAVAIGFANNDQTPDGNGNTKVDFMFVFDSVESISAVESMLATAKIEFRRKETHTSD